MFVESGLDFKVVSEMEWNGPLLQIEREREREREKEREKGLRDIESTSHSDMIRNANKLCGIGSGLVSEETSVSFEGKDK